MNELSPRVKASLGIIILGLLYTVYRGYSFFSETLPKYRNELTAKENELSAKKIELKKVNDFVKNLSQVKQELKELNLQLESALEHMPRLFQFSALLRRLTLIAQSAGIELTAFKPKNKEEKSPAGFYSSIPVEITITGPFSQQLVFFDQVSRLRRIINIESLTMVPVQQNEVLKGSSIYVSTVINLRTYRFLE